MHNHFARIQARLVWDRLARVFGRAAERERLGAVEGGGFALFARLVRVDLFMRRTGRQNDGVL